jgi:hypothetical protein
VEPATGTTSSEPSRLGDSPTVEGTGPEGTGLRGADPSRTAGTSAAADGTSSAADGTAAAGTASSVDSPGDRDPGDGPVDADTRPAGYWLPEAAGVTLLATAVTGVMNLQILRSLRTAVPHDIGDPLYFAWQLKWVSHALLTDPTHLYSPPVYLGAKDNLTYTDTVLGYAPLGWALGGSGPDSSVLLLNVAILVSIALSFLGAYALARVLGSGVAGGLVAGAGFAFAPWRLEQITHVNVMSTGVAALALAALCRGHGWSLRTRWRPERVHAGWILAGWLLAALQLTYGFADGVVFGYVVALTLVVGVLGSALTLVRSRRRAETLARIASQERTDTQDTAEFRPDVEPAPATGAGRFGLSARTLRSVLAAEVVGGLVFAVVAAVLVRPYYWVVDHFPEARRDEGWLFLSPPWRGLVTAPDTSIWWGARQASWRKDMPWVPEMVLLPGFILIGLAVLGLLLSAWPWRRRLAMLVVTVALVVLSVGIRFPGDGKYTYLPIYHHAPGWDALRTPGRLMIWVTLALALFAAGLLTRLQELAQVALARRRRQQTTPERRTGAGLLGGGLLTVAAGVAALVLVIPAAAVTVEGRGKLAMQPVRFPTGDLSALPQPVLVLPFDLFRDYQVMAWQTDGWPRMANGGSSFDPAYQAQFREATKSFPSPDSIAAIRAKGVATVVVVPEWAPGSPWADAAVRPVDGLGITRRAQGDLVVFDTR